MAYVQFTLLLLFAYLCYKIQPGTDLFSWHPILTVAGVTIVLYEGIAVVRPKNYKNDAVRRHLHILFQFLGGFFVFTGFSCAAVVRNRENLPHFSSPHAVFGMLSGTIFLFQVGFGIVRRFPKLIPHNAEAIRLLHPTLGAINYFFYCVTVMLGLGTAYMKERSVSGELAVLIWLPLLAFGVSFAPKIDQWLQWGMLPSQKNRRTFQDPPEKVQDQISDKTT